MRRSIDHNQMTCAYGYVAGKVGERVDNLKGKTFGLEPLKIFFVHSHGNRIGAAGEPISHLTPVAAQDHFIIDVELLDELLS